MEADAVLQVTLAAHTAIVLSLSKDGRARIAVVRQQAHHWGCGYGRVGETHPRIPPSS
jgi:hypothetical protein